MSIPKLTLSKSMSKEEFFGKLFQIRDRIHLAHLSSKSYAQHIALGDFYDGILSLTDSIVEGYQGKYGIVKISIPQSVTSDPVQLIKSSAQMTDMGLVYSTFQETWIQNQLDEISALCYRTIYKLENLK